MKRIISSVIAAVLIASSVSVAAQSPSGAAQSSSTAAQSSSTAAQSSSGTAGSSSRIGRSDQYWMTYASKLPIGSTVRVRTTDGERMTAVLAIVDDSGITLEPKTRIPERPRHVPFEKLDQITLKEDGNSVAKAVGIGLAVGVGSFLGLVAILASAWD
jgi:hypothetical protein